MGYPHFGDLRSGAINYLLTGMQPPVETSQTYPPTIKRGTRKNLPFIKDFTMNTSVYNGFSHIFP